jgi:glycosyltransferase involved in cell wall biosynthesis
MRVVIVSKTFVAETAQRQLEWIARSPEIELTLVTPPDWRSDDGRTLTFTPHFTSGYATRTVPVLFNGHYHFYVYRGLRPVIAALAPDLLHIDEEPYNPAGAQVQRLANALGVPSVFVAWQNVFRTYPLPFSRLEQYNYRSTAHIIAGNVAAADVLRRKGYTGPLSTFSVHGVDPEIYHPLPGARDGGETVTVGYIGRLVLYKGVGLLIQALAALPARVRLVLVGSGPDEAELRRLAADLEVADRVEFAPAVPASEVPRALADMDVLALPSLTQPNWMEQFGRVLIEAMACEVAVVGSDSGEIPHVVGDAGRIVPEGDVDALAATLRELVEQPEQRAALARRGRERVLAHFTQEQVARRTVAVWEQVLAEHPRTARARQGVGHGAHPS